ncbi:CYTH and CHAD domain-containing protein [Cryptosporangium minutisporangium]|uniref:CYTH and CHAD domain-containing protein n=1 Tax=Cryptosporangium minutisporangium TaxID=113569 RepID=A0ABP6T8C2_9ACTN
MAQTAVREIERKYELPEGVSIPSLDDLPGIAVDRAADVFELEAVYFDTTDLRLATHRVTLRRRTGGEDAGWHLKLPAGPDGRDEIHWPLGRASRTVPAELAALVAAYTRGRTLEPVARIRTTRTRRRLRDTGGSVLAEVVADEVAGQTLGAESTLSSWSELEVELAGGSREVLDTVEARLRSAGVRRSPSASKLARVLGTQPAADQGAPRRRPTVGQLVVDHLREQVWTMLEYDPRVRRDEPDAVHKMRVATRRLRSALQTFGAVVDRSATRPVTDELKWLAGVLGEARDLEVLRASLDEKIAATADELVVGPVQARVTGHLAHQQGEAREHVLAALNGKRYFALLDALDALVEDPPLTRKARGRAARALPRTLRRGQRRVARRVDAAAALPSGEQRDVELHEARKAAKRARYAGELARPALGKAAKRYATAMEDVQEELGAHQDSVVARQVLRELGMQAHLAGENGFTFGLLHRGEQAAADAVEARIPVVRKAVRAAGRALR